MDGLAVIRRLYSLFDNQMGSSGDYLTIGKCYTCLLSFLSILILNIIITN